MHWDIPAVPWEINEHGENFLWPRYRPLWRILVTPVSWTVLTISRCISPVHTVGALTYALMRTQTNALWALMAWHLLLWLLTGSIRSLKWSTVSRQGCGCRRPASVKACLVQRPSWAWGKADILITLLMAHRVFLVSELCTSGYVPLPANTTMARRTTEPPPTKPTQTFYFLNSAVSVFVYNPHFIGLRIISCKHLDRTLATMPLQWLEAKTSIWQETAQERHPLHFFPIARYPLKMCSAHSKDSLFSQITGVLRCMSQRTTARHFNVPCACSLVVLGK